MAELVLSHFLPIMKILFTADLHIKLGQKNVPVEWAKNRYNMLLDQLYSIIKEEKIDTVIFGGDIFDRLPTMEELEVFFGILGNLPHNRDVFIYSGNHEAVKKNTTFLSHLHYAISKVHPNAWLMDSFETVENMDFIPYNKLKEYNPADVDFSGDILFTHVRGAIPPHVKPEVDLNLFNRWKIVFAGDLHSHSNSQGNIVYPGSPVTTSFHRNRVDTGVIILDSKTLEWKWVKLDLPQLIRKSVSSVEDMVKTDFDHTIYELEGDLEELSKVKPSELLDKKVVQKESQAALSLTKEMSMEEELRLYLKEILKLDEEKTTKIVGVFNDISKDVTVE